MASWLNKQKKQAIVDLSREAGLDQCVLNKSQPYQYNADCELEIPIRARTSW